MLYHPQADGFQVMSEVKFSDWRVVAGIRPKGLAGMGNQYAHDLGFG